MFVSNVSNVVTFVSYFIPEKYNETTVIYEGYFNKEGMDERIADVIKTSAKNFVPAILSEDKPFIESCQYGRTAKSDTKYLLEEEEQRIEWFLEALEV